MTLTVASVVAHSENQVAAEVDGEIVLMSIDQGKYFNLGEMGSQVWRQLDRPRAVSELCDELQGVFEVDRAICERDVLLFLEKLLERGLLATA